MGKSQAIVDEEEKIRNARAGVDREDLGEEAPQIGMK